MSIIISYSYKFSFLKESNLVLYTWRSTKPLNITWKWFEWSGNVLSPIRRRTGSDYWPVLDWSRDILFQNGLITNIIHMDKFCHQRWKIIFVVQSICKSIHQGPGTGWLLSNTKNYWNWTLWKELEGLQECPTCKEFTSEEWIIRETGHTLWHGED